MGVAKFARNLLEFPFWTDVISLATFAITTFPMVVFGGLFVTFVDICQTSVGNVNFACIILIY